MHYLHAVRMHEEGGGRGGLEDGAILDQDTVRFPFPHPPTLGLRESVGVVKGRVSGTYFTYPGTCVALNLG